MAFLDDKKLILPIVPVAKRVATMNNNDKVRAEVQAQQFSEKMGTITLNPETANAVGAEKVFDRRMLHKLSREQNRYIFSGEEMDAFVSFYTAHWLLDESLKQLEPFLRKEGVWRQAKSCEGSMKSMILKLRDRYDAEQMITLANIMKTVEVHIVSSKADIPEDEMVVNRKSLHRVCDAAMKHCSETCHKSRKQSKDCPLRRAFCQVPGLKAQAEMNPFQDETHCLFDMMELEGMDDEDD